MTPDPRVLLVTGASSGIGRAVARQAAARGDHVVLVARDRSELEVVAGQCDRIGAASTLVLPADIGDDDAVADLVDATVSKHGRLDGVANCAGVVSFGDLQDVPREIFDGVIRTNLTGSANVARHALRVMREQGYGSLVLVGSLLAHLTATEMTPYVVSKWGVRALARQLQIENREHRDVSISYVAPGGVDTPIWSQAANFARSAGRPPPLSDDPEKVARVVLARIDHPRNETQVGPLNDVLRFGFSFLPGVYDRIISPALRVLSRDRDEGRPDDSGNVLEPQPEGDRLRGEYDGTLARVGRQLRPRAGESGR